MAKITNRKIFPEPVERLLRALCGAGFFHDGMLIGSWVMPVYGEILGIRYVLHTMDIDFAVRFARKDYERTANIEEIIVDLGYLAVLTSSGVQKFSKEGFTVEFITHRQGNRDVTLLKQWNVTAVPLPFVNLLLDFPVTADFVDFQVVVPAPEAFFLHKLITAQRRPEEGKRSKDLDQCSVIAQALDPDKLKDILSTFRFSKKTIKHLRTSCEIIGFLPQTLGM